MTQARSPVASPIFPKVETYETKIKGKHKKKVATRVRLNPHLTVELGVLVDSPRKAIAEAEELAAAHT